MERSVFQAELRATNGGENAAPQIQGYAAVFNQLSVVLYGMFREQIAPGAFAETLQQDDIRSLWNHNDDFPLGRKANGTLRLQEDQHGLYIENDPPDTQAGRDALVSIRRQDVNQMSFMFDTLVDDWSEDPQSGQIIRTLYKVKLYEVSPVTFPAYPATVVGVRNEKLGALPKVPDWVQARLSGHDAKSAQVRLALRRRRLDISSRQ